MATAEKIGSSSGTQKILLIERGKKMSLRKKLTLSMISIAVIPVVVLGSFCYQYFSKVLLNNVQQRELQNNNQIIYSLDDFFNSLSKISDSLLMNEELTRILQNTYQGSEARLQNYRDKSQVEELLYRNGYYLDNRIETIAIFPENSDMFYYCTKKTINPAYDVREEKWYSRILEKEGAQALIGIHQNGLVRASFQARQPYCVTIGRSIYSAYESRLLGTIIINVNVRDLQELWPESDQNYQEKFYLVDDENRVVFSDSSEEIGGQFSRSDLSVGISSCEMEGALYDAMVSESGYQGWKSVKMVMRSKLDKEIAVVPYMTITLVLVLIGLAVLISLFISKIFTRPLQELYVKMRRFEAEKSGNPLLENQVEVKGLSRSYNRMIEEINSLTIKNYETELQLRRAELMALQSQINPHFIYNTLNSIKWMADMQGSKRMVTALDSLIKLMQFSSKNSQEAIRIQDEIDLIKDYINLINLKYFDRIVTLIRVEPGVERYETLKFLLQPIVENSIYHGFNKMTQSCAIKINISRKGDRILYEVIDNGKGMSEEKIRQALKEERSENSHSFNKIGLYNVNKRIQYTFGGDYGVKIDSELGRYTRVLVEIPARIYKEGKTDE